MLNRLEIRVIWVENNTIDAMHALKNDVHESRTSL